MDNQPSPANNMPQQPVPQPPTLPPNPASVAPTAPPVSSAPNTPIAPISPDAPTRQTAPTAAAPQVDSPKKKSKGLLIGIICAVVLLIGGAIAAFIIIKTQPSNIIASSINNLLNAKHVSVEGNVNIVANKALGDNYVNINFDVLGSESNYSTTAQAEISLPMLGIYNPITLELNEVLISDGKVYAKIKGIKDVLNRSNIIAINGPAVDDNIINYIENIGKAFEDRWVMISLEELLNNPSYSISEEYKQSITSQYDCTKDKINNISNYSDEISGVFRNHPFIEMQKQQDSFYDISINSSDFANFINAIPHTKLFQDLISCTNQKVNTTNIKEVTAEEVDFVLATLPNISAKFDGFIDYHLSELKINNDSNYYNMSTNLKFNYDGVASVSIPSEFTPITEIISEIMALAPQTTVYPSQDCAPDTKCVDGEIVEDEYDF